MKLISESAVVYSDVKTGRKQSSFTQRYPELLAAIDASNCILTVEELASKSNMSCRQLERLFNETAGVSPKLFLRKKRLDRVKELWRSRKESLTRLCYEAGYFDQSHMIRDFKKLTGLTPREYFKSEN